MTFWLFKRIIMASIGRRLHWLLKGADFYFFYFYDPPFSFLSWFNAVCSIHNLQQWPHSMKKNKTYCIGNMVEKQTVFFSLLNATLYSHFHFLHSVTSRLHTHTVFAHGHFSSMHTTSFLASHRFPLLKEASFAVSFLTFFPSPVSFFSKLLTGCAEFGSLLFSPNPLPDFPSSQIYKDFRGSAVRHQMARNRFQLLIYSS